MKQEDIKKLYFDIIEIMRDQGVPLKAKQIAAKVNVDKKEVNRILYGIYNKEHAESFIKVDEKTWRLAQEENFEGKSPIIENGTIAQFYGVDINVISEKAISSYVISKELQEKLSSNEIKTTKELLSINHSDIVPKFLNCSTELINLVDCVIKDN